MTSSTSNNQEGVGEEDDPYIYLEDIESEQSMEFAKSANAKCLSSLGDPKLSCTGSYTRILAALDSNERIPYVSVLGYDDTAPDNNDNNDDDDDGNCGEMLLYNFWKDSKNPKGLWRKTTLSSYQSTNTVWSTVLDLDILAKEEDISWVWKGYAPLPRVLDDMPNKRVTRVLLSLSRGGADAIHVREFDLLTETFVDHPDEMGFVIPEGKTRARYKSRNVLLVGANTGDGSMTTSGYPRTVREWKRGTKLIDAPIVFEGEDTDVSCSQYISNETHRALGAMYEVQSRSISFYNSLYFVKMEGMDKFVKLAIALNTEVSFFGRWMILKLKDDWEACDNGSSNTMYKSGSLIYVDAHSFLDYSSAKEDGRLDDTKEYGLKLEYHVLFEPIESTSYAGYSTTKNYLILYLLDDVKERLKFFKFGENGGGFKLVYEEDEGGPIQSVSASGVDSNESDLIWLTTSSYTQPSTLYLANGSKCGTDEYIISTLKSLPHMYNSSGLEVKQLFAVSTDGTKVPYFMVAKKGLVLDGSTPTLLYGYGGFEISLGPGYATTVGIGWLERGGVYVVANIRGGGEYGPTWHQSALKANRNKSYEDFIAVGKHLVSTKVCSAQTLACKGGSNGGLLTGNMLVQAPDLFAAIHIAVPLLDMMRYNKLLAGASWMAEYGNPDTNDWQEFLHKYSPYHNIDPTRDQYPNVLITTSTRDDRVHPAHARKMVKKLWDMSEVGKKDWKVYYYENIEGGHGGAADSKQEAFMTSLSYDFMWRVLTNTLH